MPQPKFPESHELVDIQVYQSFERHRKRFNMEQVEEALRRAYPAEFLVDWVRDLPELEPAFEEVCGELGQFFGFDLVWLEERKGASA